jgi:hypothetical protein
MLGGQWWVSWQAYTSFFRDVMGLELEGDLWDRDRAYARAQSNSGWWWPHRNSSSYPTGHAPSTSNKPANTTTACTTPRARNHWADGYALHFWHGTEVPASLVKGNGWTIQEILAENTEIRRCAIERMGWDEFIAAAGLRPQTTPPTPETPATRSPSTTCRTT